MDKLTKEQLLRLDFEWSESADHPGRWIAIGNAFGRDVQLSAWSHGFTLKAGDFYMELNRPNLFDSAMTAEFFAEGILDMVDQVQEIAARALRGGV